MTKISQPHYEHPTPEQVNAADILSAMLEQLPLHRDLIVSLSSENDHIVVIARGNARKSILDLLHSLGATPPPEAN